MTFLLELLLNRGPRSSPMLNDGILAFLFFATRVAAVLTGHVTGY